MVSPTPAPRGVASGRVQRTWHHRLGCVYSPTPSTSVYIWPRDDGTFRWRVGTVNPGGPDLADEGVEGSMEAATRAGEAAADVHEAHMAALVDEARTGVLRMGM